MGHHGERLQEGAGTARLVMRGKRRRSRGDLTTCKSRWPRLVEELNFFSETHRGSTVLIKLRAEQQQGTTRLF